MRAFDDDGDGRRGDLEAVGRFVMKRFGRAVMSGVLLVGMVAPVAASAQGPRPGQYASSYYGNGYRNDGYRDNGYRGGYDTRYYRNDAYYYDNHHGVGPGTGAAIGGIAGVVLGGLLGGGKGALIGGAAGAGVGAIAGAANQNSRRGYYGY
ncbi:hypothetical protein [Terriglobus sp. ADX1]|uniref:hypothetical protein n=1 Tax=Terriglobus sp. ADX1 TaxID=2794063 RepID=UPI002FE583EB